MYNDINDEDKFPDFEQWHALNRANLPKRINEILDKSADTMGFLFFWKHYEHLLVPKFYQLLEQQFPLVFQADESFVEEIETNIIHRIFEFSEEAWKIAISNKKGLQPKEVCPETYELALNSKTFDPTYYKLRTMDDISEHSKHLGEDFHRQMIEESNAGKVDRAARLTKFNKQVIDVFQPDLLELLPELLDMDVEWWRCYKFSLEFQCFLWRENNEQMDFLIKYGFNGEWLKKDFSEVMAEVKKKILAKEEKEIKAE